MISLRPIEVDMSQIYSTNVAVSGRQVKGEGGVSRQ